MYRFCDGSCGVCHIVHARFLCQNRSSAYQLGENYAQNMGVNIKAFRVSTDFAVQRAVRNCVTAFAGPISFVGIAVPHLD